MSLFSLFMNQFKKKETVDVDILIKKIDNALESSSDVKQTKEKKFWINNGIDQKLVTESDFETKYRDFYRKGRLKSKNKQ